MDPVEVAQRCNVGYDSLSKQFKIKFFGQEYYINHPEYSIEIKGKKLIHNILIKSEYAQILIIRFLLAANFIPFKGRYYSYKDFPWGDFYCKQFHERCINKINNIIGKYPDSIRIVMNALKPKEIYFADCSCYEIEFLKGIYIRCLFWEANNGFPASAKILFSNNIQYAFSAEDVVAIGDVVVELMKN